MADAFENQEWVKLGVASALARQFETDQRPLLQLLADTFTRALPGQTAVRTKGLFGPKRVVGLEIDLGDVAYAIEDPGGGSLVASKKKIVRGIVLKTEPVPMKQCLSELSEALEAKAQTSQATHDALADALGLSH
jgi:hypothetical protein